MTKLATLIANLKTRRAAVIAEISAISTSTAGGLPNNNGTGVNIDHQGYKKGLYDELKTIQEQLISLDVGVVESEGY